MKNLFLLFFVSIVWYSNAQHKCASQYLYEKKLQANPTAKEIHRNAEELMSNMLLHQVNENPKTNPIATHKTNAVITIPVVVHVVYRTPSQNISEAQIREQIRVLNEDYRLKNPDSLPVSHPFWPYTSDAQYEFCLATTDPSGNPTNGIIRSSTTTNGFDADINGDDVKFTITGGQDNWDPHYYLNVWVCDLINGVLGYATFADQLDVDPQLDGIVVGYNYFGTGGVTVSPNNLGRTLTHEAGHWLGLYHPCETSCENDFVSDTPPCEQLNYGCPSFPRRPNNACGGDANGEMYMDFMDYVDDACMNTFTYGQTVRMHNQQNTYRPDIATANKCVSTASINDEPKIKFSVYPNPSADFIEIYLGNEQLFINPVVEISDALGRKIYSSKFNNTNSLRIETATIANGSYIVSITDGTLQTSKPFYILH